MMDKKSRRIRILDLQDQFCQTCENQMAPLRVCMQCCEIGKELKALASGLFVENVGPKSKEEWNNICRQAITLYEQGFGTTEITKKLGCPSSTLRHQMKKRGFTYQKKRSTWVNSHQIYVIQSESNDM